MLFADWLQKEELSYQEAANRIGCTRVAVYYWAMGTNRPTAKWNSVISEVSAGQVLANDHQNAFVLANDSEVA